MPSLLDRVKPSHMHLKCSATDVPKGIDGLAGHVTYTFELAMLTPRTVPR